MRRIVIIVAALAAASLLLFAQPKAPAMGERTVVVELFTSQG